MGAPGWEIRIVSPPLTIDLKEVVNDGLGFVILSSWDTSITGGPGKEFRVVPHPIGIDLKEAVSNYDVGLVAPSFQNMSITSVQGRSSRFVPHVGMPIPVGIPKDPNKSLTGISQEDCHEIPKGPQ